MNTNTSGRNNLNVEGTALGPLSFLLGRGVVNQIILAIAVTALLYIIFMSAEIVYTNVRRVTSTRVDLLPKTVNAENRQREFEQNPLVKGHVLLPYSDNERTGVEFSYSFFMYVNPSSFRQEEGLLHIMHKGNPFPYPLMCPGVFMKSNTNTLRVYANSSQTWNNYIDVENIPVKKWVHIAIVARANAVEVYVNGNIAKKLNMEGGVIYQNFGNLFMFSQRKCALSPNIIPSLKGEPYQIFGPITGQFSRVVYFNYAVSYTEIQSLLNEGPNQVVETDTSDQPPYLRDDWWVANYSK